MVSIRDVLNKIKWSGDLDKVEVWYVHRGAPDDRMVVNGGSISDVGRSFLKVGNSLIPHHRVFRIIYHGKVVFDRRVRK
jgi:uncharacterized protein (UPF0248 family)